MKKERISALVVVEGKSDTNRLKQFYDVDTFETSGMGINEQMLKTLKNQAQNRTVIILTDPDRPGEYIRRVVTTVLPNAHHAILPKNQARAKNDKRLGIEYANKSALDEALKKIHIPIDKMGCFEKYTNSDMLAWGFIGYPNSKMKRNFIADELHLGSVNAKQFLQRLNMFLIERQQIEILIKNFKE